MFQSKNYVQLINEKNIQNKNEFNAELEVEEKKLLELT